MIQAPKRYFLSGIGGSGMLPLALILKGLGHDVSGSDRSRDQGRTPQKFADLEQQGIALFPQDGSGVACASNASPVCMAGEFARPDYVVVSSAVEDTVPDIRAAKEAHIPILKRAELLAQLFNDFPGRIAVGGTSGKTTTTGMIGFILNAAGRDPVLMNGGVLKNHGATALIGKGDIFVTESDESDGSIALYKPDVAVLTNIAVDHKGLDELRQLFRGFVESARVAVINRDNPEALALAEGRNAITYSVGNDVADVSATNMIYRAGGLTATIVNNHTDERADIDLQIPGAHNLSNALAAIAAVSVYGVSLHDACKILSGFQGIRRRMDIVGTTNSITVIDDFAHNPDKISATLSTLRQFNGRLLVIFQMHGYGPLKLMWRELADAFATHLGADDRIFMPDPLYLGGTADRSIGTKEVVAAIGPRAAWCESREAAGQKVLEMARPGDRIVVMGARDDTLSEFAGALLHQLQTVRK